MTRHLAWLKELLAELGGAATTRRMVLALAEPKEVGRFTALRGALEELFPRLKAGDLPTPTQLGFKLRSLRGRVSDRASLRGRKTNAGIVWEIRSDRTQSSSRSSHTPGAGIA